MVMHTLRLPNGFPRRDLACRKILETSFLGRAGRGDACLQEGQSSGEAGEGQHGARTFRCQGAADPVSGEGPRPSSHGHILFVVSPHERERDHRCLVSSYKATTITRAAPS